MVYFVICYVIRFQLSSGDSSQSTPTKHFHISRVINAYTDTVADTNAALEIQTAELEYENYIKKRPVRYIQGVPTSFG